MQARRLYTYTCLQGCEQERAIGGYEVQDAAAPSIKNTYDAVASLLNCNRDQIALMENRSLEAVARASFHYYNADQELYWFINILAKIWLIINCPEIRKLINR